ncbi:hypothetical protein S245_037525, partial [Arachis hypogaea]
VLYFHKLKHGDLDNCQEPQPWLSAWTAKELSAMAATIQPEAFGVPGGNDGVVLEGAVEEHTMGTGLNKEDTNHTMSPDGCKIGSDRREGDGDDDDEEPIARRLRRRHDLKRTPKSCSIVGEISRTSKTERTKNQKVRSDMKAGVISSSVIRNDKAIAFDDDDEDNQPIGKRIHIKTQKSKPQQQKGTAGENIATSLPKISKKPTETYDAEPKTPSATMIDYLGIQEYSSEFFDVHPDILSQRDPECERLWAKIERCYPLRAISIDPIQTIIPKGSSVRTPSPPRPSFSLGMTQIFKTPIPSSLDPFI